MYDVSHTEPRPVARHVATSLPSPMPLWKRAVDVLGALVGLVLFSPVFAVVAVAISLDSPGGSIYRQRRVGLGGRTIEMYKFRTMFADNDPAIHRKYVARMISEGSDELRNSSGAYKLENDPRVTRVGAALRRTSLDELPQLMNVLAGDMSLVGPRPPLQYEVDLYTPRQRRRLDVVPGMTGMWQVSGRNSTTFEQMVDLDIEYIERRSFALDFKILLETVSVVILARGA